MGPAQRLLQAIGRFSEEEIALFENKAERKVFKKNDILLNEGQVCRSVFYIVSGAAYQFSNVDIAENIIGLHTEEDWCLNYFSFVRQKPSDVIIKAYSDLEVLELSIVSIHELISAFPSFFQLGRILEQTVSRVQYFDNANTASEKHDHLLSSRPELFQKFPLKMIASYLKIAPETLSRTRSIR